MGPTATVGYGAVPPSYPVDTAPAPFDDEALTTATLFGELTQRHYFIADGDGNGLADVFQLVPRQNGTRLEYSQTDRKHSWCSLGRDHALDIDIGNRTVLMGDYSRTGRNDLLLVDNSGDRLSVQVSLKPTGFEESITIPTLIPSEAATDFLTGDHDRDGFIDLFAIAQDADVSTLTVYSGADNFSTELLSVDIGDVAGSLFTLGDPNLDGLPDLFVVSAAAGIKTVAVLANGYQAVTSSYSVDVEGDLVDVAVNDYDGDGRGDLWFLDTAGVLTVRLGNTRIPGAALTSWHNAADWECDPDTPPYVFDGLFRDDDGNIHEANIDFIGELGITKGCNPPHNDDYCPDRSVTRGEMAAFLVRTFGLTDDGGRDWFTDDGESVLSDGDREPGGNGCFPGARPGADRGRRQRPLHR